MFTIGDNLVFIETTFVQIQWFSKYNRSLATYMRSLGHGGLDLTQVSICLLLKSFVLCSDLSVFYRCWPCLPINKFSRTFLCDALDCNALCQTKKIDQKS